MSSQSRRRSQHLPVQPEALAEKASPQPRHIGSAIARSFCSGLFVNCRTHWIHSSVGIESTLAPNRIRPIATPTKMNSLQQAVELINQEVSCDK